MSEPRPIPTLDELVRDPERAVALTPEIARRLLIAYAPVKQALELAAQSPATALPTPAPEPANGACRWLTPDEAASITNVPRRTIYAWSRRADWKRFVQRPSRKVLRIEEAGFRRWLERPR